MADNPFAKKWKEMGDKVSQLWSKHRMAHPSKSDSRHEELIVILQKRYGYSREQAASEITRHYSNLKLS